MTHERLRCSWEVVAGLVPGQADGEYSRQFSMTSSEWERESGLAIFVEKAAAAQAWAHYLQLLCSNGRAVNWTRVDFIWY
jgi:hypothetical protein